MLTMQSSNEKTGFTLLEVLIAFSILAVLLTVIMQSQAETVFFLEKTGKLQTVQQVVMNQLSQAERNCAVTIPPPQNGVFESDHALAGDLWQQEINNEMFMGMIQFTRITYRISWENPAGGQANAFESSIYCGR